MDHDFYAHKRQGYPNILKWEIFREDYRTGTLNRMSHDYYRASTPQLAIASAIIRKQLDES